MVAQSAIKPTQQGEETGSTTVASSEKATSPENHLSPPKKEVQDLSGSTSIANADLEKSPAPAESETPPRDIDGWKWILVVASIFSTTFLFALDQTVVADVQPAIVLHFGDVQNLPWLSVAFLVGSAATNLTWGKIFGQFNAKWTYILCVVLFEAGSALCAAAPTIDVLIIGRAISGIGGAGMYIGVMTLLAANTTIQERPLYIGATGLLWGLGIILGPIVGGGFSDSSATWRFAFWINLIIFGLFAPVYLWLIPNHDPRPGVSIRDRFREMDFVGGIVSMGAFTSGVLAISFGGVQYEWKSGTIIGLFVCSGVLFTTFGVQQVLTIFTNRSRRIFPVEFFKSRTMLILFAMTAAGGTSIFIPIYIIPVFFQFTRGDTALDAGVRLLPFIIIMIFSMFTSGAVLSKYGLYLPWYTVGGAFVLTGGALLHAIDINTSVAKVYGYLIIVGFGVGLFAQTSYAVAQATVKPAEASRAIGFLTTAQVSGVTIALAIANSIFLNGIKKHLANILPGSSPDQIQSAIAGAGSAFVNALPEDLQARVLGAIVDAQSQTYILVITFGALVLVLSLFMRTDRLFYAIGAGA